MKTKNIFLPLFVILLFTTAGTSVSAQTNPDLKAWSCVAQDDKAPNAGEFTTPGEFISWLKTKKTPSWVVPYASCNADCQSAINEEGATRSGQNLKAIMAASNDKNHFFKNGELLEGDIPAAITTLEKSMFIADVEGTLTFMALGFNEKTGAYSTEWVTSTGIIRCLLSRQPDGVRIIAKARCGQTASEKTSEAIINNEAKIVGSTSSSSDDNTEGSKKPKYSNQLTPEEQKIVDQQMAALKEKGGIIFAPIIINHGGAGGEATVTGGGSGRDGANGRDGSDGKDASAYNPANDSRNWVPDKTIRTTDVDVAQLRQWQQQNRESMTVPLQPQQSQMTTACGGCESAWNRKDVAVVENELIRGNKYARRTARATEATAVGVWVMPVAQPFINWGAEKLRAAVGDPVGGRITNIFSTIAGNTTASNPTGQSSDFPNSGGSGNCPAGFHWNGTYCVQ